MHLTRIQKQMKQKLTEFKGKIENSKITLGDVKYSPLLLIDRKARLKISKERKLSTNLT